MYSGLQTSAACAFFVGPQGEGDWAREELDEARDRAVHERDFRLFPVLLPGVAEPFDRTTLPPFLANRTWVDFRPGLDDRRALQALINAIKGIPLGPAVPIEASDAQAPYQGLRPFDEAAAEFFFGRAGDVQRLLEELKASRFLAVLGPSGSGKSSLVRAGLVPALRRGGLAGSDTWTIRLLTPGGRPLETLAAALTSLQPEPGMARTLDQLADDERTLHLGGVMALTGAAPGGRLVWVVDQAEEMFTLCHDDAERAAFIANLLYAASVPGGQSAVVLTLRADFYQRCAAYPDLAAHISRAQYLVSPLDEDGLREAISEPARLVGLELEPGLVDTILDDVLRQPGALPLLEHALLELWERRRGNVLTLEGYREAGGVEGALAKRAESIYSSFDPAQQAIARRALMRLTEPGEGTEDTRRRASIDELVTDGAESASVESVVAELADARLLTVSADAETGQGYVDIAHEALIRGWPRVRGWLDEDRQALRVHRRLTEAAHEWSRTSRDPDLLYRGTRLAEALEWRERNETSLNELERTFVEASAERQRSERAARERGRRRLTVATVGLAAVFMLLAVLAGLLWLGAADNARRAQEQTKLAQESEAEANAQRRIALSRQLAAQAAASLGDLDLSLLLSVEATRAADTLEARSALLTGLLAQPRLLAYLARSHTEAVTNVAFSPNGRTLASGSLDGTIILWDVERREQIGEPLVGHTEGVSSVAFSPDGRNLASGSLDGTVILWDVERREQIGEPLAGRYRFAVTSVAFSPDGRTLASGSDGGTVILWDVERHEQIGEPLVRGTGPGESGTVRPNPVAFSPDGRTLASGSDGVILWDVERRERIGETLVHGAGYTVTSVAFSPDGRTLASSSLEGTIILWDVDRREQIGEPLAGHTNGVSSVAFSPDARMLVSGSLDGTIILWDVERRERIGEPLVGHTEGVSSVAFSPDGRTVASGGGDGTIILWEVDRNVRIGEPLAGHTEGVASVAFSPDGRMLVSGSLDRTLASGSRLDGTIILWDVERREQIGEPLVGHTVGVSSVAFSPDGRMLVSGSLDRTIILWDVERGEQIGEPLAGHTRGVMSVAFSPDGRTLASGSLDATIILWDVERRQPIGAPLAHLGGYPVTSVAFSPDGRILASGNEGREIILWDVERREPIGEPLAGEPVPGDIDRIAATSVAFSPDGRTLASGSLDRSTVILWDVERRQPIGEPLAERLARHTEAETAYGGINRTGVMTVAFSPDGRTLASSSLDRSTVILWDIARREQIGEPLAGHTNGVSSVAFSPDGRTLASASLDGTIILWDGSLDAWASTACEVAGRNVTQEEWRRYLGEEPYHETCPSVPTAP